MIAPLRLCVQPPMVPMSIGHTHTRCGSRHGEALGGSGTGRDRMSVPDARSSRIRGVCSSHACTLLGGTCPLAPDRGCVEHCLAARSLVASVLRACAAPPSPAGRPSLVMIGCRALTPRAQPPRFTNIYMAGTKRRQDALGIVVCCSRMMFSQCMMSVVCRSKRSPRCAWHRVCRSVGVYAS
jgi:hypothetical protein